MDSTSKFLDIDDLERRWKTSKKTVYGMRYRGDAPPALRVGRELRWRLEDVEAWEAAHLEPAD